jgi:enediyne biosynthesis protein E4
MTAPAVLRFVVGLAIAFASTQPRDGSPGFALEDVTAASGLKFTHHSGATGRKFLPETLGAGAAFVDIDGDGAQDVVFANGTNWVTTTKDTKDTARVFRNDGKGRFTDVTARSGIDVPMYGMGVAAADYDNDGRADLFFTAVGQSRLFHNEGNGRFADVSERAGFAKRSAFSTSAAWLDYDRDGRLDLFICNYVRWTAETDVFCSADGTNKSYCTPQAYPGATSWLFRNKGDGTFTDVTAEAGILDPTSKALGVTVLDSDRDGWPDLFVANDTQPNKLYRNTRNGRFVEAGVESGLAFSEDGRARAGMGTDAADLDNSGLPSVVVTNFSGEMIGLYRPTGDGHYEDRAAHTEVGRATRLSLGFGCFFFDADLDGLLDLLVVNGHIDDRLPNAAGGAQYAEAPHLFQNRGGRLVDVAAQAGAAFATPKIARGAAFADIDADGTLDVLITTNGGPARLYRNRIGAPHRAMRITLRGTKSNRDGIGAQVRVRTGTTWLTRMVRTGSSYLSQSELPLTFGLGVRDRADEVVVEWPSGAKDSVGALTAGRAYTLTEGKGMTASRNLSPAK